MARKRPLIGVCAYEIPAAFGAWRDVLSVLVPATYSRSVHRAGGMPLAIPPVEGVGELVDVLDGLVFTGGADIEPALYRQQAHPETAGVHAGRDRAELELMKAALAADLPVLAICRGMQMLNVARGGDLHQHIPDRGIDGDVHKGPPGTWTRHPVEIVPGTRLTSILGGAASTHSCHHQAPDHLGDGLVATATAEDGTVEAIEDPGRRFAVGVLWHPEEDPDEGFPLFPALVEWARDQREVAA